ncbi:MAG: hypothetical protein U0Z53_07415 [Blastocatellia bacterium]
MLEQIFLLLALTGCLALVYRRLRPRCQGGCHSGAEQCREKPGSFSQPSDRISKLTQISPRKLN